MEPRPRRGAAPAWTVTAVSVSAGGAHPSYAHGYYERDNAFYVRWDEISRDRDRFREWMQRTCSPRRARRQRYDVRRVLYGRR